MEIRDTQISLQFLIGSLYGQTDYRRYKDHHSFTEFKRLMLKIFKSVGFAIRENVRSTDPLHMQRLLFRVEDAEGRIKATKEFHDQAIKFCGTRFPCRRGEGI
jgi:hypothetical protein